MGSEKKASTTSAASEQPEAVTEVVNKFNAMAKGLRFMPAGPSKETGRYLHGDVVRLPRVWAFATIVVGLMAILDVWGGLIFIVIGAAFAYHAAHPALPQKKTKKSAAGKDGKSKSGSTGDASSS